jgi:hypothetical protein
MRIEIQLRIVGDDDRVISVDKVLHLDRSDDRLETVGLSREGKAVMAGIQERVVTAQTASFLDRHRCCSACGRALLSKGPGQIQFRTAFGTIPLSSPRFYRCCCQPTASRTFRPLSELFTERTAPELLYLETRWASLVSFSLAAELLNDLLPIGSTANACTIRRHLHKVAARHDADLGGEQQGCLDSGNDQLLPQVAVIVGIDGGYVRYTRGLAHHNPVEAAALECRLERIKWRLWHGDADEALTRVRELAEDVAALDGGYPKLKRLARATADLTTYIANNAAALPNYSERWFKGERISTAFVESTVNLVVSRRFAKKQQMQWSKQGAHRLLQTRTKALDGTLRDLFTTWYPAMAANDNQDPALAMAV